MCVTRDSNSCYLSLMLSTLTLSLMAVIPAADARDEFDINALGFGTPLENSATLQNFIDNNALLPGSWLTSVYFGEDLIDKRVITYTISADKKRLEPQLSVADLRRYGVRTDAVTGLKSLPDDAIVGNIADYIDKASYFIDTGYQTLSLRVPQLYLDQSVRNGISPELWDDGVPATWLSYDYHGGTQHTSYYGDDTSHFMNLTSGANFGPWRLYNNSTWSNSNGWDSINTWLQRAIKSWQSQLYMGQTWSDGELFDSVSFTGVKLETDTDMLPYNLQGFAPTISGIANSDARVTVKQNGYVIYQTWVSAGPFELKDISQVTSGGDLEITVREADGSERSWIQSSSSVPMMLRQGAYRFSFSGGQYRDNNGGDAEEPGFVQGTVIYGLPYGFTIYGGQLASNIYLASLLGMGIDLHQFGSVSFDVTGARSETHKNDNSTEQGLSWRAQYAKSFEPTNTTVSLASYRYSTSSFYTFQETLDQRANYTEDEDDIYSYRRMYNRRSRWQININQSLVQWGSLYINASQQDYWDLDGHERTFSLGYSNSLGQATYSLNYSQTSTPGSEADKQVAFTLSVPLDAWMPNAYASYSINQSRHGPTNHQAGINGTLLEDNNLSYSVTQSYQDEPSLYSGSSSLNYRGAWGEVGGGYNYSDNNSRQYNWSARGSVVAHPHGVTLGQPLYGALAIVHTEGASGIHVLNGSGITTDMFGNAIVPSLRNYRNNRISLNSGTAENVDITRAVVQVVPTDGAVLMATFDTKVGTRVLATLRHRGKPVPFGAIVTQTNDTASEGSIVGDAGEVYLSGINDKATLKAQWGAGDDASCIAQLSIPEESNTIVQTALACE